MTNFPLQFTSSRGTLNIRTFEIFEVNRFISEEFQGIQCLRRPDLYEFNSSRGMWNNEIHNIWFHWQLIHRHRMRTPWDNHRKMGFGNPVPLWIPRQWSTLLENFQTSFSHGFTFTYGISSESVNVFSPSSQNVHKNSFLGYFMFLLSLMNGLIWKFQGLS